MPDTSLFLTGRTETAPGADTLEQTTSASSALEIQSSGPTVIAIDTSVEGWETLAAGVEPGAEILLVDSATALTEGLAGYSNIASLQILSHGDTGTITIGGDTISSETLGEHAELIAQIKASLGDDADILLYGCRVADSGEGEDFLASLSTLTGADIAASDDLTGAASLGGDWDLEIKVGDVESELALTADAQQAFSGLLPVPGTIYFSSVNNAGVGGGDASINASVDDGVYTLIGDGTSHSTYTSSGLLYTSANESQLTLSFSGGQVFTATHINIYNVDSFPDTFTISSNLGGSFTTSSISGGIQTVDISSLPAGITSITIAPTDGSAHFGVDDLVISAVGAVNTAPSIAIDNTNLDYTENDAAVQIDSAGTVSDSDGDADWNGGTLAVQITGNAEAADTISISDTDGDGTAITVSGTNILSNGTDIGDLSVSGGTVTGGTTLTITFDSDATNTNVQEVLQSLRYSNSSDTPGTSNRTITVTATDADSDSNSDTRTVAVTAENDLPQLGGTPANDTATEDAATAIDLSAYNISDADGDTITLTLAVDRGTLASIDGNGTFDGVTISNTGTASMTLQGTAAALNTIWMIQHTSPLLQQPMIRLQRHLR